MEVKNCRGCGRLFNVIPGVTGNLCPACKDKLEEKFMQVKTYIEDNKGATLQQISDDNDVSVKQIEQWVREDRLCFADDSPIGIDCQYCGKMIKSGKYCDECKNKMSNQLGSMYKEEKKIEPRASQKRENRMRFLDK